MDLTFPWLRRAYWISRERVDDELAAYGLTWAQLEVLAQLWRKDGLEQRVLQERLGVAAATLTNMIDGLVEHRYLQRQLSPDDARVKQLFLTERGYALQEELQACARRSQARLLKGFSITEAALLHEWLQRIINNMSEPDV